MGSSRSDLTALQRVVLKAFFARERDFCLTGGAALVGFHQHHRSTKDLDLFTREEDAFERARHTMADVASELRDVFCLEARGLRVEAALEDALAKDGGCTPATLAWLLSEVRIEEGLVLPAGVSPTVLRAWLSELVGRLRLAALPSGSDQ